MNELEQLPPNLELSGGVGMLFKESQLSRGKVPLAQPSARGEGEEHQEEEQEDDAVFVAAAAAAKRSAEHEQAAQDLLSLEERLLINKWAPKHYLKGIQLDKSFGQRSADSKMTDAQKLANGAPPEGQTTTEAKHGFGSHLSAHMMDGRHTEAVQVSRLRKNELKAQERRRVEAARKPKLIGKSEEAVRDVMISTLTVLHSAVRAVLGGAAALVAEEEEEEEEKGGGGGGGEGADEAQEAAQKAQALLKSGSAPVKRVLGLVAKAARKLKEAMLARQAAGLLVGQETPEFEKTELRDAEAELMVSAREPQLVVAEDEPVAAVETAAAPRRRKKKKKTALRGSRAERNQKTVLAREASAWITGRFAIRDDKRDGVFKDEEELAEARRLCGACAVHV